MRSQPMPCYKAFGDMANDNARRRTGHDPFTLRAKIIIENREIPYADANGRRTMKVVPTPSLLRTVILPPCATTIMRAIESPNP